MGHFGHRSVDSSNGKADLWPQGPQGAGQPAGLSSGLCPKDLACEGGVRRDGLVP